jgi:NAD(P)-dependent dehydrogenase (short-subunit alcohol dehydrogenase family)
MKLEGNTIFVTGGGSGIGRGLAEAFHTLGNHVIIAGRRRKNLTSVVAANRGMMALELDIADPDSIDRVAKQLITEHPDLNVLINNAGIMQLDHAAGQIDDALLMATINTNLIGVNWLPGTDYSRCALTPSGRPAGDRHRRCAPLSSNRSCLCRRFEFGARGLRCRKSVLRTQCDWLPGTDSNRRPTD